MEVKEKRSFVPLFPKFCDLHSFPVLCFVWALQYKRKSTEGVSYFLFALVIVGNTLYGLSVLLKNPDDGLGEKSYIVHHLPWLVGSLGTLTLDLIVSFAPLWASVLACSPTYMLHAELVQNSSLRAAARNPIRGIKSPNGRETRLRWTRRF